LLPKEGSRIQVVDRQINK